MGRPESRRRNFRFGAVTTGGTEGSRTNWVDHARRVESLGFSTLLVADHFLNNTVCTPRLAAAATVTTTLRLGSYVYDNDFRHPVLLARESAEIDVLSDGRMELGIGAGWSKPEYDMVGITFEDGPTRASRYEEAVGVIRALHETGSITHTGQHYRLQDCNLLVEPVQRPIPLLLGGGGPRMTRFAARQADIIGFVPRSLPGGGLDPAEFSAAAFDDKIEILDATVEGRPDGGPERGVLAFFVGRSADELPRDPQNSWTSPEVLAGGPYALIGDTEHIVDTLLERRERWGLTYLTCWEEDIDAMSPVVARLAGT
ncbi:MAG TPA: TIGR03621 family F420-dependent LLM class oxidoreductase [Actinomycetes bacterium]|nr:TIGR03621 family F420-dependent LLM class oxidoreductase [Actinomycetes bacterium]